MKNATPSVQPQHHEEHQNRHIKTASIIREPLTIFVAPATKIVKLAVEKRMKGASEGFLRGERMRPRVHPPAPSPEECVCDG